MENEIKKVYEKYKHMSKALMDVYHSDSFIHTVAKDLWIAIVTEINKPEPPKE
jgi:hypothetical protein